MCLRAALLTGGVNTTQRGGTPLTPHVALQPPHLGSSVSGVARFRFVLSFPLAHTFGMRATNHPRDARGNERLAWIGLDACVSLRRSQGIVLTQLWERTLLLLGAPLRGDIGDSGASGLPPHYAALAPERVHAYTALQLLALSACWAVNLSPLGLCVSFVIVALVPLRARVLPSLFSELELKVSQWPRPQARDHERRKVLRPASRSGQWRRKRRMDA